MRDIDLRRALMDRLHQMHAGDGNTRIVQEMGIWSGSVRVDIAVINGELHGFELKSPRDTLERLPRQAALYSEVFDRVTLVVAERYAKKAAASIPDWWGISLVSEQAVSVVITEQRPSVLNPNLQPIQLARLLWKAEALAILEVRGKARGVRSKSSETIATRLVETLSLDELRFEVRQSLKAREAWLGKPVANEGHVAVDAISDPGLAVT